MVRSRTTLMMAGFVALSHASIAAAQFERADTAAPRQASRVTVTPGAKYGAGWLHRFILGGDYRFLWTTPIEVDVLNMDTTAGGLRPTQRGGSMQTTSLRFIGQDDREYVFRPAEKDFSKGLPEELRATLVRDIAQDQTVGYHPAAALIVARLLDATGIHHPRPSLVVMPNDPRLGEFRAEFAGLLGTLEERPGNDFDESGESLGATSVISSEKLFERMRKNHQNRADARAYLAARLFDVLVGDRDRHRDQWRWARFSGERNALWEPIPRDRDMPFARFEGLGPWIARGVVPQLVTFTPRYPDMVWLNWNAREIDRRLLVGLERTVWDSVAKSLQRQISDAVIDSALEQMPLPYRVKNSAELRRALIERREKLPQAAASFYGVLAREVDFSATDDRDIVEITREENGSVRVELFDGDSSGGSAGERVAYLHRQFRVGETREVRIFLDEGDDRVLLRGVPRGDILLRIIGGDGDDALIDSIPGGDRAVKFYDASGEDHVSSAARIRIDRRPFTPPTTARAENAVRDWGEWSYILRSVSISPAIGLLASLERTRFRYGFRNDQFATRSVLRMDFSVGELRPRLTYAGTLRHGASNRDTELRAMVSGIELIRFHGLGNETPSDSGSGYYRVFQNLVRLEPGWEWRRGRTRYSLGARGQYGTTRDDARTLVGRTRPYGSDEFGEVGFRAGVAVDRRDSERAPTKGYRLTAGGSITPELWDVASTFGEAHAGVSTYVSASLPLQPTLALRLGGQHLWGTFPFYDAAFLGGSESLRGWDEQRFSGRSSFFGNSELRLLLGKIRMVVPAEIGVLTFADVGKVVADGEHSNVWHAGYGGGVWIAPMARANTVSLSVGQSRERRGFYLRSGFAF
jgi:hypothetical protein